MIIQTRTATLTITRSRVTGNHIIRQRAPRKIVFSGTLPELIEYIKKLIEESETK